MHSFARLIAPVVTTTTSITLSTYKIQNGDILVPANPNSRGKWLLKWRERERVCICERAVSHIQSEGAEMVVNDICISSDNVRTQHF